MCSYTSLQVLSWDFPVLKRLSNYPSQSQEPVWIPWKVHRPLLFVSIHRIDHLPCTFADLLENNIFQAPLSRIRVGRKLPTRADFSHAGGHAKWKPLDRTGCLSQLGIGSFGNSVEERKSESFHNIVSLPPLRVTKRLILVSSQTSSWPKMCQFQKDIRSRTCVTTWSSNPIVNNGASDTSNKRSNALCMAMSTYAQLILRFANSDPVRQPRGRAIT
jgi:hypothetical protein